MATVIFQNKMFPAVLQAEIGSGVFKRLREILPSRIYNEIERFTPISGRADCGSLEEIRLRRGRNVYLTMGKRADKQNLELECAISSEEITRIFEKMCDGSLYTYSESIVNGYISIGEGIRVGVCGRASLENGRILGIYDISALNIRIPHALIRLDSKLFSRISECVRRGSGVLVYSPPAEGKTTLLRSLCAMLASTERPMRVALVDSREEFGYMSDSPKLSIDILSGYPKAEAISIATAFMNPEVIICDEIGAPEEACAVAAAQNCGVPLIASTHGEDILSVLRRPSVLTLHDIHAFGLYVGIRISDGGGFKYIFHTREEAQRILEDFGGHGNTVERWGV